MANQAKGMAGDRNGMAWAPTGNSWNWRSLIESAMTGKGFAGRLGRR